MTGAFVAYFYMVWISKKELKIEKDKIQSLCIYVILAAFIGGKLLFFLEKPSYYFNPPSNMLNNFRQGFVFYGSLLFAIPTAIWYFRKEKWPVWSVLDRLAIAGVIVHMFGRMGCFFAGCCYGLPTDGFLAVTFTDPISQAEPLHTPLHPTQLYEATFLLFVLGTLLMIRRNQRFDGQVILIYIALYSVGRGIIEVFRGDLRRGFVIEDILSHSQFISLLLLAGVSFLYFRLRKKNPIKHS